MQLKVNDPGWQLQLENSSTAYARLAVDADGDLDVTVPAGRSVNVSAALSVAGEATIHSNLTIADRIRLGGYSGTAPVNGLGVGGAVDVESTLAVKGLTSQFGTTASEHTFTIQGPGARALIFSTQGTSIDVVSHPLVFKESGVERGRYTAGVFAWGTTVVAEANAGDLVLSNGRALRSVNAAGTSTLDLLQLDSTNRTQINLQTAALRLVNGVTTSAALGAYQGKLLVDLNGVSVYIPYHL